MPVCQSTLNVPPLFSVGVGVGLVVGVVGVTVGVVDVAVGCVVVGCVVVGCVVVGCVVVGCAGSGSPQLTRSMLDNKTIVRIRTSSFFIVLFYDLLYHLSIR
jgi:hypothetical protein